MEVKKGFAQKVTLQPDLVVLMNHRELVIPGSESIYKGLKTKKCPSRRDK